MRIRKLVICVLITFTLNNGLFSQNTECPKPFIQKQVTEQSQIKAAKGLISRITPGIADHFILEIIPKEGKLDTFELEQRGEKLTLRGSSGVAISSAFNYYLKHYCKCQVTWCGDQLNIPQTLPIVDEKITIIGLHQFRPYFNYCTLSYTATWWRWDRWEREIDIMALNGINMPLSVIGLEGIWYYALLKHGFTDIEARQFLVAPTHFAWQWMTNIQGDSSEEPLPKSWIDQHIVLGRKIIERQRGFGMIPIQQGFSGSVPRKFIKKFPEADIVLGGHWCAFESTAQLDPLDPLFKKFGKTFLQTGNELFGTSHYYAADPFHEGHPPKPGKEYLTKVGKAIFELLCENDSEAMWAMQSWSILKEIACAVPVGRLLVLDLAGKKGKEDQSFWGHNFIKGQLHNFGGRINLHGDLTRVANNDFARLAKATDKNRGMGLFMEAIEQNPVYYQLVFDMIWRDKPVVINDWLNNYAERRYGAKSVNAEKAWKILLEGPYKKGTNGTEKSSIIAARPALDVKKSGPNSGFLIPYDPKELIRAWELLLADSDKLQSSDAYLFDIMDIGRQVLSNLGQELHNEVFIGFVQKDKERFEVATQQFLDMLNDVDSLLSTRREFSFGRWINEARSWGKTDAEKNYYEWNASKLVTIWGPSESPHIFDYSWREWSGLIKLYYRARWERFYTFLGEKLEGNEDYLDPAEQTHAREAFRANEFYDKLASWEIAWTKQQHAISSEPKGSTLVLAKALFKKYKPLSDKIYMPERLASIIKFKKDLKLKNNMEKYGVIIGEWNAKELSKGLSEIVMNVSKHLDQEGSYCIAFTHKVTGANLEIESVTLLRDDEVISKDKHLGFLSSKKKKMRKGIYTVELKEHAFNTNYIIKVKVKSTGYKKSYGSIWIKKK